MHDWLSLSVRMVKSCYLCTSPQAMAMAINSGRMDHHWISRMTGSSSWLHCRPEFSFLELVRGAHEAMMIAVFAQGSIRSYYDDLSISPLFP